MNKIGIVLEIEKDKAVVISSENEYFYIKLRPQIQVGRKIKFNEYDLYSKRSVGSVLLKISSIAASIVLVLAIWFVVINTKSLFSSPVKRSVFAYLDIYSNANIELTLDENLIVMGSRGLNDEGRKTLKELDLKNKKYDSSTKKFINTAIDLEYVNNKQCNDNVIISGAVSNSNEGTDNEQKLKKALERLSSTVYETRYTFKKIKIFQFDSNTRELSYNKDISMSLYGLFLEGLNQNLNLNIDNLKNEKLPYLSKVSTVNFELYSYEEPSIELKFDKKDYSKIEPNANLNLKINIIPNYTKKAEVNFDNKLEKMLDEEPFVIDFTNIKSGKHNIKINVFLKNGYKISKSTDISVDEQQIQKPSTTPMVTPSISPVKYSEWDKKKIYNTGDIVSYDGKLWQAQWWADGLVPGTTGEYGAWKEYKK